MDINLACFRNIVIAIHYVTFVGMVYIDPTVMGMVFVDLNHLNPDAGGLVMGLKRLTFATISFAILVHTPFFWRHADPQNFSGEGGENDKLSPYPYKNQPLLRYNGQNCTFVDALVTAYKCNVSYFQ